MRPVAEGLARVLETVVIAPLNVGVIANVNAEVNTDSARVKELLVQQVTAPVRWEESMEKLPTLGCEATLEIGPGKVLAGLLKRIVSALPCASFGDPAGLAEAKQVIA
jgi:[acyl-carrier-protein] S-malonyltransferase